MASVSGGSYSNASTASAGAGEAALASRLVALLRGLGPALGTTVLPFALVVYLALEGGGYDAVVRSEVGIAIWWIVLVGALAGLLPVAGLGRAAWVGLGLVAALAAWTALGVGWSESSERSVEEVARVGTYLGVLALALAVQRRDGLRRTLSAVGVAIGAIALLALLSRLHPAWFPVDDAPRFLPGSRGRLNYPLNYWNGLAALMAIGVPLLLVATERSRRLLPQALAAASLPVVALVAFYTFSRGGALEIAVGLLVLVALHPRRLALLPTLTLGVAGSALAVAAATQRDALEDGLGGVAARQQGDEMLAFVLVVCAGVALVRVALGLATRHGIGPRLQVSRRAAGASLATLAIAATVVAIVAGAPGELSDRWEEFKDPVAAGPGSGAGRFDSASGQGRYQWWQAALDANATEPLLGIGPGTYEYWWAREATIPAFVRDAHSLYLETLAELGIVGLGLVGGLLLTVLGVGTARAVRAGAHDDERAYLAGAVAAVAAFAVAAAVDWVWELAVIPAAFLLLAAAILASPREAGDAVAAPGSGRRLASRVALAALAVPALGVIAVSLAGASTLRDSQAEVRNADLGAALDSASTAHDIQPYAATPSLQRALVLELDGDLGGAAAAAREATRREATNWRTWLTLSRIEAERGRAAAAVDAYRRARSLNPRFELFATARGGG